MSDFDHTTITPVQRMGNCWVKREDYACKTDDHSPSGLKVRQFLQMAAEQPDEPMIVGCASYSAMQIYVAWAAEQANVPAHIFVPQRKERTMATQYAESLGATIHEVFPGYANVYRKRARDLAKELGGCVRWDSKRAIYDTALQCMNIPPEAKRVVVPTGSGLTAAGVIVGLAIMGRSDVEVIAVCVSDLADEDNIMHNVDYMLAQMTRHYYDPILAPRTPVLRMERAQGDYGCWVFDSLPYGDVLDPFYSAKAMPFLQSGDVLWVSGIRPIESCPPKWQELYWEYQKELDDRSASLQM